MTKDEIEKAIIAGDKSLSRDDDVFKAQCVMLASAIHHRFDTRWLAKFTDINQSLVCKFAHNLRKGGIWRGRKTYADWADEEEGGVAFVLDSMVAAGLMERSIKMRPLPRRQP